MAFDPGLTPGETIDNERLCEIFKCSPQGGMRRSTRTNTLVLTSGHINVIYEDRWVGNVLHYTGQGLVGDQELESGQNRTLALSPGNGVDVHLFEVHREKEYTYSGRVVRAGEPYAEQQPDKNGQLRRVWVFPLAVQNELPALSEEKFGEEELRRTRRALSLTAEELARRAKAAPRQAGERPVTARQFERNPYVVEFAKRRANGHCELCGQAAPFVDDDGRPYLETHHIEWLARGGEDAVENTVALCPNCHRRMHVLDRAKDRVRLRHVVLESLALQSESIENLAAGE